ncbi:MAG: hypothetical protein Q4G00_00710 [Clostridia bacterium]|nr:hypothetical protein [Clostridia bacterium]
MPRIVYKLRFTTPVHFGAESGGNKLSSQSMAFRADLLFSALYLQGDGDALLKWVKNGRLWFSDAFPYHENTLYLPKPIGIWNRQIPADDPSVRKQLKKIAYIPIDQLNAFVHGNCDPASLRTSFGTGYEVTRVNRRDYDLPLPYQLAGFRFADGCGLYLIVSADEQAMEGFEKRLLSLSANGIGGKVSSGWGKFVFEKNELPEVLAQGLDNRQAACQMLLSTALPEDDELDSALRHGTWLLVRRGGFSYSPAANAHKKHTVFLLGAGSVFPKRFRGTMLDVGLDMPHPVWRCAMAGFMGVDVS